MIDGPDGDGVAQRAGSGQHAGIGTPSPGLPNPT